MLMQPNSITVSSTPAGLGIYHSFLLPVYYDIEPCPHYIILSHPGVLTSIASSK